MEILRADEIKEAYKDGRRNFTNVKAVELDLSGTDLSGSDFSNSDLSRTDFTGAKLVGTNFENCDLSWCDFTRADLTNANFSKAETKWGKFISAILENVDFSNANLSYTLFINTIGNPDFSKASTTFKMATSWEATQEEVWERSEKELGKAGFSESTFVKIKSEISSFKETLFNSLKLTYGKFRNFLSSSIRNVYSQKEERFLVQPTYGTEKTAYTRFDEYKAKRIYGRKE